MGETKKPDMAAADLKAMFTPIRVAGGKAELEVQFPNCWEADYPEVEVVLTKPVDGGKVEMARFVVRQIDFYERQATSHPDMKVERKALIRAGLISLVVKGEEFWKDKTAEEREKILDNLSRSRMVGGQFHLGLFEYIALTILGNNTLSEAEAKN